MINLKVFALLIAVAAVVPADESNSLSDKKPSFVRCLTCERAIRKLLYDEYDELLTIIRWKSKIMNQLQELYFRDVKNEDGSQNSPSDKSITVCYNPLTDKANDRSTDLENTELSEQLAICEHRSKRLIAENAVLLNSISSSERRVEESGAPYTDCVNTTLEKQQQIMVELDDHLRATYDKFSRLRV
ncbi:PREDICTED: uncharacterized protein LOC108615223 [Drosophila arizonae]|uniref:Uncharacterized protein LOC108615223 n=1 Tax=Drosophila arizonae TaxID=7263 RepID=A0ABM1PCX2_DROAR|nr:PREDICTED: uncharacterized protein LOC108615223 [Drosophila arizonae]